MKFGISAFVTDEGMGAGALAATVEQRGFNALCVTEHSHIGVAVSIGSSDSAGDVLNQRPSQRA